MAEDEMVGWHHRLHGHEFIFKPAYLLIFIHFPFVFYKTIKVLITGFNVGFFPTPPRYLSMGCLTTQLSSDILCLEMASEALQVKGSVL